jgi:hypothetical protein
MAKRKSIALLVAILMAPAMPALAGMSGASVASVPAKPARTCSPAYMPSWTGSPGITSFTAYVSSNPCNRSVRAFAMCYYSVPPSNSYRYGSYIVTGSSKANCGLLGNVSSPYGITKN